MVLDKYTDINVLKLSKVHQYQNDFGEVATSVPSKNLFAEAGQFIRKIRKQISLKRIKLNLYLKENKRQIMKW